MCWVVWAASQLGEPSELMAGRVCWGPACPHPGCVWTPQAVGLVLVGYNNGQGPTNQLLLSWPWLPLAVRCSSSLSKLLWKTVGQWGLQDFVMGLQLAMYTACSTSWLHCVVTAPSSL